MKVAVLAPVHGTLLALEAVLMQLHLEAPNLVVNLGDLVSGLFDPAGSADAQIALTSTTLAGNHERQSLAGGTGASDAFAGPRLLEQHLGWTTSLPPTLSLLGGDLDYLLEDVSSGGATLAAAGVIAARLKSVGSARVVLCGHTHVPRVVDRPAAGIDGEPGQRRHARLQR
jgi:predicted phosphodiesterase